jgi:hypothetical protein
MEIDIAHVHIVLNHVPSLGTLVGLLLLIFAIHKKDEPLKQVSFGILALMALATLLTYLTGNPARRHLFGYKSAALGMVELHQNAAMLTLIAMTISGTFAWFGLWEGRRFKRVGAFTSLGTLVFSGISASLILYTAGLGGKISHPEIRDGLETFVPQSVGWRVKVKEFMAEAWVWPLAETLHFIGMALLFGVFLLLLLRMFGAMKSIPFSGIHRLFPLAMLGFVLNVITGMAFYISEPGGYYDKIGFIRKIACIFLAAVPVMYFTVFDDPWRTGSNQNASTMAKIAALGGFTFLAGVMIFGRILPFFH